MRIDHVLLATADLDAAAERLHERYGLVSARGGSHPNWGTANRIVPLGGQYLELIGVVDSEQAATNPFGRWIQSRSADGDALIGFMIDPDDFEATCARLALDPTPGQRVKPDGIELTWRLAGMVEAMTRTVPCFISWQTRDAAFDGDAGVGATGIAELRLRGDLEANAAWLGALTPAVTLVEGAPGIESLTISTANGPVVISERPFG